MPIGNAFAILKSVKVKVPMVEEFITINSPTGIVIDSSENLYVSYKDPTTYNYYMEKIEKNGTRTTLFEITTGADGEDICAIQLTMDNSGNIYFGDSCNDSSKKYGNRVWIYTNSGIFSEYIAGAGLVYGNCIDKNNNLYISNIDGGITTGGIKFSVITKYDSGKVKTFKFGNLQINRPNGIALDSNDNVYVADRSNNRIYKITKSGTNSIFAGSGDYGHSDGESSVAKFSNPIGLCFDEKDNLYVSDSHKIRKITPTGRVTTIAGSGTSGDKSGIASQSSFNLPYHLAYKNGIIYILDYLNNKIKKLIL